MPFGTEPVTPVDPPDPDTTEEPEQPVEKNSNGTARWSEWVAWNGDNSKLYGKDDGVTREGGRYISKFAGNGSDPLANDGWWTKAN